MASGIVGCVFIGPVGCGDPGPSQASMDLGKEVYNRPASCVTCHQSVGQGDPPLYPPLRKNPNILADDPERLIKIVTHGLAGPLEVRGEPYDQVMAGLGSRLTPEEVAAVLNYVRNSWRNEASGVTVEQVLAVQEAHAGRKTPWTVAELEGRELPAAVVEPGSGDGPTHPAAWGEVLYHGAALCASCHGSDGAGVPGSYPPLAGSPWVTGDRDRLIKVSLHGVGGEMQVLGETYSNEMPGQGALLNDEQLAATLTFIRQAWGNDAGPIYPDHVAKLRAIHADRHEPWPAEELAAIDNRSPLTNVRYRRVDLSGLPGGVELNTPAFDALPVLDEGVLESSYLDINQVEGHGDNDTGFGVVFEADFDIAAEDQYHFALEGTGSALLLVDGEVLLGRTEIRGNRTGGKASRLMSPGTHTIKLYFAKVAHRRSLSISARADSVSRTLWALTPGRTKDLLLSDPNFLLIPESDQPIVLRARFEGQGNLGLAVGHPLRVNYAYDFGRCQLTGLWRGDFVNAAGLWLGRNDMHLPPAGEDALELTTRPLLARLDSADADWPAALKPNATAEGYDFVGHRTVDQLPVFYSRVDDAVLRDLSTPLPGEAGGPARIQRALQVSAAAEDPALYALLAEGDRIEDLGQGVFAVDGKYRVVLDAATPTARILEQDGRQLLVAPAVWDPVSIDLPAWVLRKTDLAPQAAGFVAAWTLEYRWID